MSYWKAPRCEGEGKTLRETRQCCKADLYIGGSSFLGNLLGRMGKLRGRRNKAALGMVLWEWD